MTWRRVKYYIALIVFISLTCLVDGSTQSLYPTEPRPTPYRVLMAYCQFVLGPGERPLSARGFGFPGHMRCHRYLLYCVISFTAVRRFNLACPIGLWWSNERQLCVKPDFAKNDACHRGLCKNVALMAVRIVPDYRLGSCFAYYECRNASFAHQEFCENSHKFDPSTGACQDVALKAKDYCTRPEPIRPCKTKPFFGNNVIYYNSKGKLEPCSPGMLYSAHYCDCVIPELE